MLEFKDVSLNVGNKKILSNINLQINIGEITTIIGPNGSGKSSLIKILTKNNKDYQGEVKYNNKVYNNSLYVQDISILQQYTQIPEHMTCYEFVKCGLIANKGFWSKPLSNEKELILDSLLKCNVTEFKDQRVSELSGGERQRVLLAAAIVRKPKILILDEPTTYLDIKYQAYILNLIKELNKEMNLTVLLVLHDINQAVHISDNIVMLKTGKILYKTKAKEVAESMLVDCFGIKFLKHYSSFIVKF